MIRLTHRRCRAEAESLHEEAEKLNSQAQVLAEHLQASEHAMEEVADACTDVEYATTEADIPAVLRERLVQADLLPSVEADLTAARAEIDRLTAERDSLLQQRVRVLQDAHDQGRLVQVLALTPTGAPLPPTIQVALEGLSTLTWKDTPWPCLAECGAATRLLAWHQLVPERAHLSCECGRAWPAPAGVLDRGEQELATRELFGGVRISPVRWADRPQHELLAIDWALPTPAQCRDRGAVPA